MSFLQHKHFDRGSACYTVHAFSTKNRLKVSTHSVRLTNKMRSGDIAKGNSIVTQIGPLFKQSKINLISPFLILLFLSLSYFYLYKHT